MCGPTGLLIHLRPRIEFHPVTALRGQNGGLVPRIWGRHRAEPITENGARGLPVLRGAGAHPRSDDIR